jgi:hypothetical protein
MLHFRAVTGCPLHQTTLTVTRDLWKCVLTCGEMSKPGSGEFVFDYLNRRLWTLTIDIPVLQQPMSMWWYNVEN